MIHECPPPDNVRSRSYTVHYVIVHNRDLIYVVTYSIEIQIVRCSALPRN